jgi:lysocardiolipin and lysophospholipid acyltransferase
MYWRRFAVSEIPIQDKEAFEAWVLERWREKDELLETFYDTGRFPSDEGADKQGGYIETDVRLSSWLEIGQIFVVLLALAMVANVLVKMWEMLIGTRS